VTGWAALAVPTLSPLPRTRQTLLDLIRRLSDRGFLLPTTALVASTAALACGVGFLPLVGAGAGLGPVATGAAVSVLAAVAALSQPWIGRARDAGRLTDRTGMTLGLVLTGAGLAAPALLPHLTGLLTTAGLAGIGTGLVTPLAFAALAATSRPERIGQTLGSADVAVKSTEPVDLMGLAVERVG
jgi:DHA1 family tetracycline resistance protein-like MFS transporter